MATKNSNEDEQLRQRNKDAFQSAALYWNKLANERLFEISKQLLGIALIILPLSGSIVLSGKRLSYLETNLLVACWASLFTSILAGFINLWIEANYFNYLSNDSSRREEIWSDTNESVTEMEKATKELGKTKPTSTFIPLIIQGATLFVGILLLMVVVYSLMIQNSNLKHPYRRIPRHGAYFNLSR